MKTLVKNTLGNKTFTIALPCNTTAAEEFATMFLDGTSDIYDLKSSGGTSAPVPNYKKATLRIFDSTTKESTYLIFCVGATKNEQDVKAALLGKRFNGV